MILAIDFDGVIMDGINECMLVTWNVFNKNQHSDFSEKKLQGIPLKFKESFTHLRNFVRHDGHFIVAFFNKNEKIIDMKIFNEIFESIPETTREEFKTNFISYRSAVREIYNSYWISLHKELINLQDIIKLNIDIRIVSGKDTESILKLLYIKNINIPPKNIHGRMLNKEIILSQLKTEADREKKELVYIDDNINNVIDIRNLNINSLWAFWGFHTEEQIDDAKKLNIVPVYKNDLIRRIIYFEERK